LKLIKLLICVGILMFCGCSKSPVPSAESIGQRSEPNLSEVNLSFQLPIYTYKSGEDIPVVVIVKNNGKSQIKLTEGQFFASIVVNGEPKRFLQSVHGSYAAGFKTIKINPYDTYEEEFIIRPKDWGDQKKLEKGSYKMRVQYIEPQQDHLYLANENCVEDGIVKTLVSDEATIYIK
jgi:hypothetical protein